MAGLLDNQYRFPAGAGVGGIYKLPKGYNVKNELKDIALLTNSFAPVTGDIQSGILAANDLKQGNYGSAALNGLGLLPFVPSMAGMIASKGDKVADAIRPLTQYELAQQVAQKNAVEMLGLPPNNTAMDRARAMGGDTPAYHATHSNFDAFNENQRGTLFVSPSSNWVSDFIKLGNGNYNNGAQIMPLNVFASKPFDFENNNHVKLLAQNASLGKQAINQIKKGDWNRIEDRTTLQTIKNMGFDGVYVKENGTKNLAVFNPNQVRSKFAAFDPARANEADLLGNITPEMAGLLAVGSGAGVGYAYNKKEKKKTK